MAAKKSQEKLVADFKKTFPGSWAKPGREWDGNESTKLWTGGDWTVKTGEFDVPAFNAHTMHPDWEFGVHKLLVAWADKHGLFFEAHDSETYMAYEA